MIETQEPGRKPFGSFERAYMQSTENFFKKEPDLSWTSSFHRDLVQIVQYHSNVFLQIPYSRFPPRGIQKRQYRVIMASMAIFGDVQKPQFSGVVVWDQKSNLI